MLFTGNIFNVNIFIDNSDNGSDSVKKDVVEYLGFDDDTEKKKVGRPRLASKETKKKSLIIAGLSFFGVTLLLVFGYGSLFGVVLKEATPVIIEKFVDSLKHFTLAYSWGGFESLIMPVYKGNNLEELKQRGLAVGQLRVYLGLEDSQLLIDDFVSALNKAYQ